MIQPDALAPTRLNWKLVWLGWLVVVLAYVPAALLAAIANGEPASIGLTPIQVALNFLPWVPAAPAIIRICELFPLGSGKNGRAIAVLTLTGLVVLPLVAWSGTALAQIPGAAAGAPGTVISFDRFAMAASATTLFMLPVYATIVGVGQTLAYVARDHARERLIARARLDAVRAQIEPHFLFNLFNAIAALTHKDAALADAALTELAAMFRRSLSDDRDVLPLSDELDAIRDEMTLHRLLVAGAIIVEEHVTTEAADALIPSRLLRPLVENAITHGLAPAGGGTITLMAYIEGARLVIMIDNELPATRAGSGLGLGLANVRDHLRVLFDDQAALYHETNDGRFRVMVTLPLRAQHVATA